MKIFIAYMCALVLVFASCASSQGGIAGQAARGTGQIPVEIKAKVLFIDGALDEYTESEYDESLTLLLRQFRRSASGALKEQVEFSYQDNSELVAKKITKDSDDVIKNSVEYQYNAQGLLVNEILLNAAGRPVSSYVYSYDSNGFRINRSFNNSSGIKMAETVYTVDAKGLVTAAETISGTGQKINSSQSQYDRNGRLTGQRIYNAGGQLTASTTLTWQSGREIKNEQFGPDGSLQMRITNEYGPDNELLKKTIEDLRGNTTQILAYEYAFKPNK